VTKKTRIGAIAAVSAVPLMVMTHMGEG